MIWKTDTKQGEAAMPTAALVGPTTVDPRLGTAWAGGIADQRGRGSSGTQAHGFTANRSPRPLGRSST